MKHLTNIIVALCFGMVPYFAIAQSDLPSQISAHLQCSGGLVSAQSMILPETYISSIKMPIFTRYYAGDHPGMVRAHSGHGVEGPVLFEFPFTFKGLNKFFPLEELIGLTQMEMEYKWGEIQNRVDSGLYDAEDLFTQIPLGQFGEYFEPGPVTFEFALSGDQIYANDDDIWMTSYSNCFFDWMCPDSYVENPYADGHFFWGTAEVAEEVYAAADMAFELKPGLSTNVENPENSTKQRVTVHDGVISFPNAWIGETFQVFGENGQLLATGKLNGNPLPVQASAYEHLLYRVGQRSGHVDVML